MEIEKKKVIEQKRKKILSKYEIKRNWVNFVGRINLGSDNSDTSLIAGKMQVMINLSSSDIEVDLPVDKIFQKRNPLEEAYEAINITLKLTDIQLIQIILHEGKGKPFSIKTIGIKNPQIPKNEGKC